MTIVISEIEVVLRREPLTVANVILANARAQAEGLGYAGDVTPQQAWALLSSGIAELVDVRTARELQHAGSVPHARHVEWLRDTDLLKNSNFFRELRSKVSKEDIVLFLCRSGKLSVSAAQAATVAGYRNVFNVLEGFEGDGSRLRGWLNLRLPSMHR